VASAVAAGVTWQCWQEWDVTLAPGREPADLLQHCTANGFALRSFDLHRPSLHDVFIHLVGGEAR
jgi:ABC-2 type transport system ATP-binding protein